MPGACRGQKKALDPWNWNLRGLGAAMWVLLIEPGPCIEASIVVAEPSLQLPILLLQAMVAGRILCVCVEVEGTQHSVLTWAAVACFISGITQPWPWLSLLNVPVGHLRTCF